MISKLIQRLKGGLIVSCQAEEGDPFNDSDSLVKFAKAAKLGGASAIRSEGLEKTKAIINNLDLPVIGLVKSKFDDGTVRITRSEEEVKGLIDAGVDIVAIDGTFRERNGLSGAKFIEYIKSKYKCVILADIATVEEGIACALAGADFVSSTLSGYTPETFKDNDGAPNFKLIQDLVLKVDVPIIAEGRITTPKQAESFFKLGVHSVVVGTAITRPRLITENFVKVIRQNNENRNY